MATEEFDLAPCLEGVRRHDQDSARALVEHLHPLVIRIVRSHLPRRAAEEDLAQDVFVKLFARLEHYEARAGVPFEHWLSRLAVRTCLDALRAEKRRPELRWSDLPEEQAAWLEFLRAEESPPPDTGAASARELIEQLLSRLGLEDRLVITLLDLEQKSVKEISQLTGWSSPLVKVRAFRARRKLRKLATALRKENPDERL
jgi:RNA polymerase sigma factor (sigma-70 family)